MALNIISGNEPIQINQVKILVYGQPGIGKSSVGFTSNSPLCLDFDRGAYRAENRKDIVSISSWTEIEKITQDDLANYNTIMIDTLGKALKLLTIDIIRRDAKLGPGGILSIRGYGVLKSRFMNWIELLMTFGKDIILIAHETEDKDGDRRIVRPDITGGARNDIPTEMDLIGYYFKDGDNRILNFNLTDYSHGKNSAGLPPLIIPHPKDNPDFMANLISDVKSKLGKSANSQLAAKAVINEFNAKIEVLTDAEQFNTVMDEIRNLHRKGQPQLALQAKELLSKKAKLSETIVYDEATKKFISKAPTPAPEPIQTPVLTTEPTMFDTPINQPVAQFEDIDFS